MKILIYLVPKPWRKLPNKNIRTSLILRFIIWNILGAPVAPTTKAHGMEPGYCKHGRRFDKDYKEKIKSQWNFWQMPPPPYERRAIDKFLTLPEGVIHKLSL